MRRLLINFAGLGDLVILIPLLRKLAENAELDILARPVGIPLFSDQSFVANTFSLKSPNRGRKGLAKLLLGRHRARLATELVKREYDEIFCFSRERQVITDWVDSWRGEAARRTLLSSFSDTDWLKATLLDQGFGLENFEPFPRLEIPENDLQKARAKLQPLGKKVVALQVGTGPVNVRWRKPFNVKGLTARQWGWIIRHVLEKGDADAVVFHGTALEKQIIPPIMQELPVEFHGQVHDWTGEIGVQELRAILAAHYAMISVDTGPAHIAAAVGCPLLTFFGPTDPVKYLMKGAAPVEMVQGKAECQPCVRFNKCRDNICLNRLTREQLTAGWDRLCGRMGW